MTPTQPPSIRAAVVQAEVVASLDEGLAATAALVQDARARGAQLIVFPETWLPGYPAWLDVCRDVALWDSAAVKHVYRRMAEESVAVPGASCRELARIAREAAVVLVVGITERVDDGPGQGTLFNAVLTFDADGRLINHHRKLVPTYTERMVWGGGDAEGLRACGTSAGRIGALICWEHWMPLARQALHESGEDIHAALWPTVHEMMQVASRHYAFEGRCFVLAAGSLMRASALPPELEPHPSKVSDRHQWVLRGGSAIIGPDGAYLAGPTFDAPAILIGDLDLGRNREERLTLDVSGHYHRPDIFDLRVIRRDTRLANDPPRASDAQRM